MSDKKESIVYYVVAAVSIFVLISYGTSRDIPPIVGFLIAGVSTYILYPNETIALSVALIVSAILRKTRREGYEGEEEEEEEEDIDEPMTNDLMLNDDSDEPMTVEPMNAGKKNKNKNKKNKKAKRNNISGNTEKNGNRDGFALTPADFTPSNPSPNAPPPSTQDMDKLSGMIDKTLKLVEMLPEGFLNNAPK
jgi:hypothetical protein